MTHDNPQRTSSNTNNKRNNNQEPTWKTSNAQRYRGSECMPKKLALLQRRVERWSPPNLRTRMVTSVSGLTLWVAGRPFQHISPQNHPKPCVGAGVSGIESNTYLIEDCPWTSSELQASIPCLEKSRACIALQLAVSYWCGLRCQVVAAFGDMSPTYLVASSEIVWGSSQPQWNEWVDTHIYKFCAGTPPSNGPSKYPLELSKSSKQPCCKQVEHNIIEDHRRQRERHLLQQRSRSGPKCPQMQLGIGRYSFQQYLAWLEKTSARSPELFFRSTEFFAFQLGY